MGNLYNTDIVAWAAQQADLLRQGEWSALDIANLAEEIEDVGKSEQRELVSRLAVLQSDLLKWQFQPEMRSKSWSATIAVQRRAIARKLKKSPSLKHQFFDEEWLEGVWDDALKIAMDETGLSEFPVQPTWHANDLLDRHFFPD